MLLMLLKGIIALVICFAIARFSLLFVPMASRTNLGGRLSFRGAGAEDAEAKVPAGPAFEISTFMAFLCAARTGEMPGAEKSNLPLFTEEGFKLFGAKYADWAPSPYSEMSSPAGPFGPMPGQSPAPLLRVMHAISGLDNLFEMAFTQTLPEEFEISFSCMKTRVWSGMAPVSEARWRAKELDSPENIEDALAIIDQVISVFKYLASPPIHGDIRHVHNKVCAEIDIFQDACNAAAADKMEPNPEYNLAKLWYEFIKCHFAFMQHQCRAWVLKRLKTLHEIWEARFIATMQTGRQINATQATIRIDHFDMMVLNKIQDLYVDVAVYVHQRLDGFVTADRVIHPLLANLEAPKAQLNQAYAVIENQRETGMRNYIQTAVRNRTVQRQSIQSVPAFLETAMLLFDREFVQKALSPEIENPLPMKMETWVQYQKSEKVERFGFVIYRLTYKQSDSEWQTFVQSLEDGLNSGWDGVVGADDIKSKATLVWIDGRDQISEGDIAAARKDFKTVKSLPSFPEGISKTNFLAITSESFASFAEARRSDLKGDYRGFLHVVDADFDATKEKKKHETAGYDGVFKIVDQMVWTDFFAVGQVIGGQSMEKFWVLAAEHPWGVYVGPTTGVRRRDWRGLRGGLGGLLQAFKNSTRVS